MVRRTVLSVLAIVLLSACAWQVSRAYELSRLRARENDVNPVQAVALGSIRRSLTRPVPFARVVVDAHPERNGRKAKVIIDPDGRGAVIGAQTGALGFALYRSGRAPARISRRNLRGEDAQAADVDGDGAPDIVVGGLDAVTTILHNPLHDGCADVYRCTWRATVVDDRHLSHDVVVGDVNHDGRIDIATESGVYFNEGRGARWAFAGRDVIPRDGEGTSLIDAEHDGILDVVAPYRAGSILARFVNPLHDGADPAHTPWQVVPIDARPPFAGNMTTAIADVNGDGRSDVVLAPMYGGGGLFWYEAPANPGGRWRRHLIDATVNFVHQGSLQVTDVSGTGTPDIAFAEQDQSPTRRVGVFYNVDGSGTRWRLQVLGTHGGHNIKAGRLGRDCRPSIVSARHGAFGGANPLVVWRNLARQTPSVGEPKSSLSAWITVTSAYAAESASANFAASPASTTNASGTSCRAAKSRTVDASTRDTFGTNAASSVSGTS